MKVNYNLITRHISIVENKELNVVRRKRIFMETHLK